MSSANVSRPTQPDSAAAAHTPGESLPALFEQQALLHPARTAIGSGAWQPSYEELNAAANRFGSRMLALGGPGGRTALLMRHDAPLFAAVLAVLKAGGAVVVLNPTDPPARLHQVLEDAEPDLIVTEPAHRDAAERIATTRYRVISFEDRPSDPPPPNPELPIAPGDLAFLVYTSGSTGGPKGVMLTHRSITHNVVRQTPGLGLRADDRIAQPASLSGGHGVASAWCALLNGATLCPYPAMEKGVAELPRWLGEHRITLLACSASVFRQFRNLLDPRQRIPGVRMLRLGSEPVSSADCAAFFHHFPDGEVLLHTYSSSETGNITQLRHRRGDLIPPGTLPAGWPASGVEVLLRDEHDREVPPGEVGEIVVRSRYLSPGYWRNEALTAERFSGPDGTDQPRLYRTGDLGRLAPDGSLVCVGRKDARLKIRGYRVEPAEVEEAIRRQPGIDGAAVCAVPWDDGNDHLVAYVTCRPGQTSSAEALRLGLRSTLPAAHTPTAFVFLDCFPLTPHGKIDREHLRQIRPATTGAAVPPRTDTETLLAGLWAEVFRGRAIDRHANFFDLGGTSLTTTVVASRVQAALGVELNLRAFFEHPTLAALAAWIDGRRAAAGPGVPPPVRMPRTGPMPVSFVQERTWNYSQTAEGSAGYTVARAHGLRGALDVAALRDCLDHLARRHEILRTTFAEVGGRPVQVVHPPAPVSLPVLDLSGAADAEEQATRLLREEARRPFDLTRLPLLRLVLVRVRPDVYQLLRVNHHIISDGWSWVVYFRELARLYEAWVRGEPPPLPEFEPLQYADFAAWQRRALDPRGASYRKAVAWWKNQLRPVRSWRTLFRRSVPPELPWRRARPVPEASPTEGHFRWALDPEIEDRLERLGRETGATYFVVRLAAFAALLGAGTRRREVILGTYATNRARAELQNLFGFFSNLVTLRLRPYPGLTYRRWLAAVRRVVSEAQAHCELPYEQLCDELREDGVTPPEIRAILSVTEQTAPLRFGGIELTWLDREVESMPWGFTLEFDSHDEWSQCRLAFDARRYDPDAVRQFLTRLFRFLDAASRDPDRKLRELLRSGG